MQSIRRSAQRLLLCLLAFAGGCDAFPMSLEEKPVVFLAETQFFRNADDALAATKAAYDPLATHNYYGRFFPTYVILNADYADGRASYQPGGEFAYNTLTTQRLGSIWNAIYSSIGRANLVIHRLPGIQMDEALRDQLIAEARFLRALNYYHLVRLWGGVPLRTEPVTGLEQSAAPRASVEEVYGQIMEDLQFAEAHLPDRRDAANVGRATHWAAKTLMADVHLTREQFAQAAAKAKEVIDSGRFTLVRVQEPDDFLKIYGPDVVESSEEIFFVKFQGVSGLGTFLPGFMNHPSSGYVSGGSWALLGDLNSVVLSQWDPKDLRYAYNRYSASETDREIIRRLGVPELFKKYRHPTGPAGNTGNDFPVLRYPDALLIFAEAKALANSGPTPDAYEAVNQVRRRAYGYDPQSPSPVDLSGLSPSGFRDAVLMERAWEFLGEAKRWFDLVRTGQALPVISALGEPISEKYLLWPIPQEEIDTNESLSSADQNPGW